MRDLDGEQILIKVYIGESYRWHRQPLYVALLERLRKEGFAGATVYRGVAGFGAHSVIHSTHLLRISQDLPIVVEIVESEERLEKLTRLLNEMVTEGLVTQERVRVLKYATRRPADDEDEG